MTFPVQLIRAVSGTVLHVLHIILQSDTFTYMCIFASVIILYLAFAA